MKFHRVLTICVLFLLVACTEKTPIDIVNESLVKNSNGRFRLEYGDVGCNADYYRNDRYYLNVPKLEYGLYLDYGNSGAKFPSLDFVDNREGRLSLKDLPIKDVRSISIREKEMFVEAGGSQYFIEIDNMGLPHVHLGIKGDGEKIKFNRKIEFSPIEGLGKLFNYTNDFISIADTSTPNYQVGITPRINCIRTIALYSLQKDNKQDGAEGNYLIGETAYTYFKLNIDTGEVGYIDEIQFSESLRNASVFSLVTAADYFLRGRKINGLIRKQYYEDTQQM